MNEMDKQLIIARAEATLSAFLGNGKWESWGIPVIDVELEYLEGLKLGQVVFYCSEDEGLENFKVEFINCNGIAFYFQDDENGKYLPRPRPVYSTFGLTAIDAVEKSADIEALKGSIAFSNYLNKKFVNAAEAIVELEARELKRKPKRKPKQ